MKTKILLIVSVVLNIIIAGSYLYKKSLSVNPGQDPVLQKTMIEKAKFQNQLPINRNDIVFVGNSLTEWFPVSEIFDSLSIKNRGVASNSNEDIFKRIDPIVKAKPKKIFLMSGVNNLLRDKNTPLQTFESFKKIFLKLKKSEAKIYIESTLPISNSFQNDGNKVINEYNLLIKNYAEANGAVYIDLHSPFLKGDEINAQYTLEGLHLTSKGYEIWVDEIRPFLSDNKK